MEFVCRVGAPDGRILEQVTEAATAAVARTDLERTGYHVFEVKPKGMSLSFGGKRSRKRRVKDQDFLIFNQELAGLLRAGLPLLQALDMLSGRDRDPQLTEVLGEIRDKVKAGEELSVAFGDAGDMFPPLYASTLMAGERSGDLEQVLRRFIRYQRLVMDTKKRIVSAFVYPTLLVFLSITMVVVMIVVVLPNFQEFYDSMEVELPLPTRVLLGISDFVQSRGLWLLGGIVGGVYLLRRWFETELGAVWRDRMQLRIPVAGSIIHRFSLSEFCRSLSTLLAGGLPLVPSLEVSSVSVSNAYLRSQLEPIPTRVREGAALHDAMKETAVVPNLTIDMVQVGEATGALDEMLSNVSDFFDDEVETQIQRLLSLVEPIMLVVMGIAVAALLLAMYMPLFSVLGQVQ